MESSHSILFDRAVFNVDDHEKDDKDVAHEINEKDVGRG